MAALTESLELMKEQSKIKMMAAIDKMKELKGNFTAKVEEVNSGSQKISELEEALMLSNQEVLKYKGAMEKAMPKFRELKSELDAKMQENIVMQQENSLLRDKIKESESTMESRTERSAEENLLDISDIHESALTGVEFISGGNPMKASSSSIAVSAAADSEDSHPSAAQTFAAGSLESEHTERREKDAVEGLEALIAEMKTKYEDLKTRAEMTEINLRKELEGLQQARCQLLTHQ